MTEGKRSRAPKYFLLIGVCFIGVICSICIFGGAKRQFQYSKIAKLLSCSLVFTTLFITTVEYMSKKHITKLLENASRDMKSKRWYYKQYAIFTLLVMLLSYGAIALSIYVNISYLWMLGGLLMAVSFQVYLGIILQFFVLFFMCELQQYELEQFFIGFIFAAGICMLAIYMRQISNLGYVIIIGVVGNFVAIVLEEDFLFERVFSLKSLLSEVSVFMVILVAAWLAWIYRGFFKYGNLGFVRDGVKSFFSKEGKEWEEGMIVRIGDLLNHSNESSVFKDALEKLGNSNYSLLKQLRETKPEVYQHSKQVAVLAEGSAEQIGVDRQLVYIGGLYHEIGRLYANDYIEESLVIGKQNGFPQKLLKIIEEHNVKNKFPTSKEAAVLMLADSVVFLLERADEKGIKDLESINGMIEGLFQIRYDKGELDYSGLTIRDYKVLREYCLEYSQMMAGNHRQA